ncbi:acetyltransferase [Vitreoscilla massiliensis]|uniref:Acetyltransferase n=1 Tax=Vitreoscilla massiliensis TaxID=1689272 RepID=A0ABY4E5D1_9NEIS|nr:acetyltransferase [Vitreoscilla massiliensis]UOO90591.1 acetyltransferase [Vitreoscilla massiliensis]
MTRLVIIGAGGHGKVIADTASCTHRWSEIVFLDDRYTQGLTQTSVWSVIGNSNAYRPLLQSDDAVLIGIGNNTIREKILHEMMSLQLHVPHLIHPSAYVSNTVQIGAGTVIFAQAAINVDAQIGKGCIINTSASVDHDCVLDDFCHISPGAHLAGGTKIGARSWVGVGAVTKQLVEIGDDCMVGAGAAVVQNVYNESIVMGVPARMKS